jgi:hypothetical protein
MTECGKTRALSTDKEKGHFGGLFLCAFGRGKKKVGVPADLVSRINL